MIERLVDLNDGPNGRGGDVVEYPGFFLNRGGRGERRGFALSASSAISAVTSLHSTFTVGT